MKFLLDTHILLWWLNDDPKLSESSRKIISNANNVIYVSHVSLWEIQIKMMAGKLNADMKNILQQLPENDFQQLPTHTNHILALASLLLRHQDLFDRILITPATSEPLHLVTYGKNVSLYSKSILLV